ncbi:MAG: type II toxin-antitoxin system VapC family toxin [Rhodocyclaceae bacterium]|nr:type II toxin-antitoxin system VapC family toxin [Rhodocyclaceae bacterium]
MAAVNLRYLLDTNILSEAVRASPDAKVMAQLRRHGDRIATSAITWHELHHGLALMPPSRKRTAVAAYLESLARAGLPVLPYAAEAAEWHARERARLTAAGRTPPFVDGQIAAIAQANGLTLVTRNTADFRQFSGLKIQNWFEDK